MISLRPSRIKPRPQARRHAGYAGALALLVPGCVAAPPLPDDDAAVSLSPGALGDTPGATWTSVEPAPDRWNADLLQAALGYVDSVGSGAFIVVDDGAVVAHSGAIDEGYQVASLRKSLLSVLLGIAADRDQLDLDASIADLDIDDLPPGLSDIERTATVRHLITARSGIYHVAAYEPMSMRERRPARGSHRPGEFWFYNNWDFNALGTVYERATGVNVFDGFDREIARPLGFEDWRLDEQEWFGHPETEHDAYVFRISARDVARVGLLMLRRGVWRGRRIVSEDWVRESTSPVVPHVRSGGGYGYMWWVPVEGRHYEDLVLPEGSFLGRGSGPHHLLVVPSLDLVAVHLAETNRPRPARWVDEDDVAEIFGLVLEARGFNALP